MGKHKRDKISKALRDNPMSRVALGDQLISDKVITSEKVKNENAAAGDDAEDNDPEYIDQKLTQKILKEVRKQQQNLDDEDPDEEDDDGRGGRRAKGIVVPKYHLGNEDLPSDEDELEPVPNNVNRDAYEPTIDEDDERALELFMKKDAEPSRKLADIIMEKFTEKKTELESQFSDAGMTVHDLHPRVIAMYEGCRDVLKHYRSGKLPKAFKIIPRLANWEQILHITEPNSWTAAAMYQATRIFTSNLKEKMAQRFFNLVLLPRIRDDILQYKKLNFHLYQALRKALFKPAAFTKGILIPLCESGTCTLREAVIIGSVLAKNSVPILHSSAAMLMIAEMDYSGANSIFIKIILDKNYALPYRVVDAVVYHFLKFEKDKRELPVLWHQAFLTFVQRYKNYISSEQKEALHALLRSHVHYQITQEIRRELENSKCRDEIKEEPAVPVAVKLTKSHIDEDAME